MVITDYFYGRTSNLFLWGDLLGTYNWYNSSHNCETTEIASWVPEVYQGWHPGVGSAGASSRISLLTLCSDIDKNFKSKCLTFQ